MTTNGPKEIIVVGGGLGGPLCALFMANRGYRVRLYEFREDPRASKVTTGRSINLSVSARGLRALRKVGLEKEILRHSIPMRGRLVHNPDGTTKSLLYDTFNRKHINSTERHRINVVLLEAIEKKSNVRLYFNHKLVTADLEIGETTFVDLATNQTVVDQADLIIGADGAYSALRRAMQSSFLFSMSQTYIDHGYMELTIKPENGKTMAPNNLHIWPRAEFMLIALPNCDGSWTATLIMPFQRFDTLKTTEDILTFFQSTFPDFVPLVGKDHLVETLAKRKASGLLMITCSSFNVGGKALLIGDAAHAMLPFYGQGMNAAFEDCMILDKIIGQCKGDLPKAIQRFSDERKEDAQAIGDLAKYNYVEMRNLVTKRTFLLRKSIDDFLYWLLKDKWVPLYHSVSFSEMSYKQCIENRRWQNEILLKVVIGFTAAIIFVVGLYLSM